MKTNLSAILPSGSLRDSCHWRFGPRVKTRGYYQVSLRDSSHLGGQEGKYPYTEVRASCRGEIEEFCHAPSRIYIVFGHATRFN